MPLLYNLSQTKMKALPSLQNKTFECLKKIMVRLRLTSVWSVVGVLYTSWFDRLVFVVVSRSFVGVSSSCSSMCFGFISVDHSPCVWVGSNSSPIPVTINLTSYSLKVYLETYLFNINRMLFKIIFLKPFVS